MLGFIFFAVLLTVPIVQAVWNFQTQFVFEAAVFIAGGLWLFRRALSSGLPRSLFERNNLPLLGAAFFSLLGAVLSPVRELVAADWWSFLAGSFILLMSGALTEGQRRTADTGLRIAAWLLAALGLYQAFAFPGWGVSASLTNPNALALFTLMLIPMAIAWRDFFLLAALAAVLVCTQSAAAWLAALAAAGFYLADHWKPGTGVKKWAVFGVLAALAAFAVWQIAPASIYDRLLWWKSALKMLIDRPLLGFGQGAFAYLYPAYHRPDAAAAASVYVHNYYLEFLAENGIPAALCWFWVIFARLRKVSGLAKYSLIAVLIHSVADFGLAVPANLFIFCYLLGSRQKESGGAVIPERRTVLVFAFAACLLLAHGAAIFRKSTDLERMRAAALSEYSAGKYAQAARLFYAAESAAPANPLIPRLTGRSWLNAGIEANDKALLFRAAVSLERALLLDPYNAGAYKDLALTYELAGAAGYGAGLQKRKMESFRWD